MVTEYEAQKLIHDMRDELHVTPGVAFRYIAGALVFFGLALAGLLTDQQRDAARGAAAAGVSTAVPHHERASTAETRRVLEERRQRFESRDARQAARPRGTSDTGPVPMIDEATFMSRASD